MAEQLNANYIIVTKSKRMDYITSDQFDASGKIVGSINTAIQGEFSDGRKFTIKLPKDTKDGEDYKITNLSIDNQQYKLMYGEKESGLIIKRDSKVWDNDARHGLEAFVNKKGKLHLEPISDSNPSIKQENNKPKSKKEIMRAALDKALEISFESSYNNLPLARTDERSTGRA